MSTNDLIIYSKRKSWKHGLFGECLLVLINKLYHYERNKTIVDGAKIIFDINTLSNGNIVPRFLVPKKKYGKEDLKNTRILKFRRQKFYYNLPLREESYQIANKLFFKYFDFNSSIREEIDKFDFDFGNTLGVHYRGSDKNVDASEANSISKEEVIKIVEDFLKNNQNITKIFCCSDMESFVAMMKETFKDIEIVTYEQKRIENDNSKISLHVEARKINEEQKKIRTKSAFMDMILLSKCKNIIKTSSALSSWSKIINPDVNLHACSAMKLKFFPTCVNKRYETKNQEINKILDRTMKGHAYVG